MNLSEFKPFKWYSFFDDSIYNQIFKDVFASSNCTPSFTRKHICVCVCVCVRARACTRYATLVACFNLAWGLKTIDY